MTHKNQYVPRPKNSPRLNRGGFPAISIKGVPQVNAPELSGDGANNNVASQPNDEDAALAAIQSAVREIQKRRHNGQTIEREYQ